MSNVKNLPFSFSMNINVQGQDGDLTSQTQHDACFSIAMMGNFSNSINKPDIIDRDFVAVDRFNFDEILNSLSPQLSISVDDSGMNNIDLTLTSLKDFQPDSLY
jgi:type VI secretion system ImpB/VipA family protein